MNGILEQKVIRLEKTIKKQQEQIKLLTAIVIEMWRHSDDESAFVLINMLRHSTGVEGKESIL